jgi:2-hydroxy-6-oxonona-2,4-dienedioate hydrolase
VVRGSRLGRAAAEWASSRWVQVQDRRVRFRQAGSGPVVVLVHGLGVSADYWVRMAPPIAAAGYRVLAPDLPGFGRSDGSPEGLGVSAQVNAVRRWADALDLPRATFVGHSISCQTALELAANYPERVRSVILAAPTGVGEKRRRLAHQAWALLRDIPREPIKLATMVAAAYARAGPGRVLRTWRMGAEHDPLKILPRVNTPGLVILGERDPVVPREFADRLAAGLSPGRVAIIPKAAHGVIFDGTGVLNRIVLEFLADLPTDTGGTNSTTDI